MDRKPRLRFRLRTLLVAVVPLCCALAWCAHSWTWIRQRREAFASGAVIEVRDGSNVVGGPIARPVPLRPAGNVSQCRAPRGLWLFGERGYKKLLSIDASDAPKYQRLFPEATVIDDRFQGPMSFPSQGDPR